MSASAIRAGRAYIELFTKDSAAVRGLNKMQRRFSSFGKSVASMGAGFLALGGTFASPFFAALGAASDLEETMNKFNVVFGENSKVVKAWGDEYAKQVGRSKVQIADFMASNQDLLVPMGFEEGAATEMSKQITGLSVDLASFNNKADADVLRDLQAALTGSGEVMKKYGVILSQAAVNQELMNQSIDPKTATEAQKAQARMNIIMRGTTAAQGDAIRSAGSWANQKKRLSALIKDTAASLGSKLLPVLTPYLTKAGDAVAIVGKWIEANGEFVRTAAKIVGGVILFGAALVTAGGIIVGFGAVFGSVATIISTVGVALSSLLGLVGILISPIGIAAAAVIGLGYAFFTMTDAGAATLGWLADQFGELKSVAVSAFGGIAAALKSGNLKLAGKIALLGLKAIWLEVTGQIRSIWSGMFLKLETTFAKFQIGISKGWVRVANLFESQFQNVQVKIAKAMIDAASQEGVFGDIARKTLGMDTRGPVAGMLKAGLNIAQDNAEKNRSIEEAEVLDQLDSDLSDKLEDAKQRSELSKNEAEIAKVKRELDAAIAEAKATKKETEETTASKVGKNSPVVHAALGASGAARAVDVTASNTALDLKSSAGISAVIAATIGSKTVDQQMLDELKKQTDIGAAQLGEAEKANEKEPVEIINEGS